MTQISDYGNGERGVWFWHWDPITNKGEMRKKPKPKKPKVVNAPAVHGDEIIGGIESMVDGKIYDSKSRLRKSYKELGYVEKGNDRLPAPRRPTEREIFEEIREDTEKAFYDLKYGRVPLTEQEKERWNQEQRQLEQERIRAKTRWAR